MMIVIGRAIEDFRARRAYGIHDRIDYGRIAAFGKIGDALHQFGWH
jgi:hypothetical protein